MENEKEIQELSIVEMVPSALDIIMKDYVEGWFKKYSGRIITKNGKKYFSEGNTVEETVAELQKQIA